jgi:hypothetical protein
VSIRKPNAKTCRGNCTKYAKPCFPNPKSQTATTKLQVRIRPRSCQRSSKHLARRKQAQDTDAHGIIYERVEKMYFTNHKPNACQHYSATGNMFFTLLELFVMTNLVRTRMSGIVGSSQQVSDLNIFTHTGNGNQQEHVGEALVASRYTVPLRPHPSRHDDNPCEQKPKP